MSIYNVALFPTSEVNLRIPNNLYNGYYKSIIIIWDLTGSYPIQPQKVAKPI